MSKLYAALLSFSKAKKEGEIKNFALTAASLSFRRVTPIPVRMEAAIRKVKSVQRPAVAFLWVLIHRPHERRRVEARKPSSTSKCSITFATEKEGEKTKCKERRKKGTEPDRSEGCAKEGRAKRAL